MIQVLTIVVIAYLVIGAALVLFGRPPRKRGRREVGKWNGGEQ